MSDSFSVTPCKFASLFFSLNCQRLFGLQSFYMFTKSQSMLSLNQMQKISWIKTPKAVLCSGWGSSPHWFLFTWRFSLFGHLIDRRGRPCDRITLFTHAQLFSAMPASKCFSFLSCLSYEYILCEWNQAKNAFGNARFGFIDRPLPVPDLFDLTGKTKYQESVIRM